MKRYAIFGGRNFYARGGFNDLIGNEGTLELAVTKADDLVSKHKNKHDEIDWYQVVDLKTGEVEVTADCPHGGYHDNSQEYHLKYNPEIKALGPALSEEELAWKKELYE